VLVAQSYYDGDLRRQRSFDDGRFLFFAIITDHFTSPRCKRTHGRKSLATICLTVNPQAKQGCAEACPRRIVETDAEEMKPNRTETAASVIIVPMGYRAQCSEPACRNLGLLILRHADAGGRPMTNVEVCNAHSRERLERDRAAGRNVFDSRG
jgi:hypothetical protein